MYPRLTLDFLLFCLCFPSVGHRCEPPSSALNVLSHKAHEMDPWCNQDTHIFLLKIVSGAQWLGELNPQKFWCNRLQNRESD